MPEHTIRLATVAAGLYVARCSCGNYQSARGTERGVRRDFTRHAKSAQRGPAA